MYTDKAVEKKILELVEAEDDETYSPVELRAMMVELDYPYDQVTHVLEDMVQTSKLTYYPNGRVGKGIE